MAYRDQPLGELALSIPRASALFRKYDMDYCCGGKQTLARAASRKALDVAVIEAELAKLQVDLKTQADGFAFDNALDTAILGKKGRSVKAVRALLDVDGLKGSADRTANIAKALDEAAKANPWAFGEGQAAGYPILKDGGTPNHVPSQPDGVLAAFTKLNPNLKV